MEQLEKSSEPEGFLKPEDVYPCSTGLRALARIIARAYVQGFSGNKSSSPGSLDHDLDSEIINNSSPDANE